MSFVLKKFTWPVLKKVYMSRKKVIFTAKLKTVQTVTKIKMMEMERELRLEDIYHVCTDGMSRNILFKDDKDFIKGMNAVAVCRLTFGVGILCFCLMSNHVHFIIKGTYDECVGFIRLYKKRMNGLLEGANTDVSVKPINTEDYLKTAIAYVLRNPVAAKLPIVPGEYRWSSGNCYFADASMYGRRFTKASDFGSTEMRKRFNTRHALPGDYLITEEGIIWPRCYVDYKTVERLYRTPAAFLYHLAKNMDMENELTTDILRKANYSDQELYNSASTICHSQFGKETLGQLSIEEKLSIARIVRKKYGASAKQISRITGLDPQLLKELL